jgi:hypothetical protein
MYDSVLALWAGLPDDARPDVVERLVGTALTDTGTEADDQGEPAAANRQKLAQQLAVKLHALSSAKEGEPSIGHGGVLAGAFRR